jgi:hypothetical protein
LAGEAIQEYGLPDRQLVTFQAKPTGFQPSDIRLYAFSIPPASSEELEEQQIVKSRLHEVARSLQYESYEDDRRCEVMRFSGGVARRRGTGDVEWSSVRVPATRVGPPATSATAQAYLIMLGDVHSRCCATSRAMAHLIIERFSRSR